MQISSPTQAQNSPIEAPPQDNNSVGSVAGDFSFWGHKVQKKNKSGIFAKLLEGLIGKGKYGSRPVEPRIDRISGQDKSETNFVLGPSGSEKTGGKSLNTDINTKKIRNSSHEFPTKSEILNAKDVSGSLSGFFKQDRFAERGLNGSIQPGLRDNRSVKRDFSLSGPSQGEIAPKNERISVLFSGKEGSNRITGISSHPDIGIFINSKNSGGDKAKNANSGVSNSLSFSFREIEAEVLKTQLRSNPLKPENNDKENARVSELKGKKGKERLKVEVRDLRTPADSAGASGTGSEVSKLASNTLRPALTEIELPVDLNLSVQRGDEGTDGNTGGKDGGDFSLSRNFEDALAGELRGNLSTDIVRDATLIVRNGGEGTIRLSLHPESLGNVKIRLEMTENKITGHIIVESSEALRAFERELPVLEKAFKDSGFSETNLDMSLAQDQWNSGAGQERQEGNYPALDPVLAASRYDAGSELTEDSFIPDDMVLSGGDTKTLAGRKAVNLLV